MQEYFGGREILSKIVEQPLVLTETLDKYQVIVNVYGGGNSGQAGAIRHGVARALILADETLRGALKEAGFLTRDSRIVERKKIRRRTRRSPQFSKKIIFYKLLLQSIPHKALCLWGFLFFDIFKNI